MNERTQFSDVIERAVEQGWRHEVATSGHHKLIPPDPNGKIVVTSSTPGDQRAFKNFLAGMRREGFKMPDDREEQMERRRVRGVKQALRDYLRDHKGVAYEVDELRLIINARVPGSHPKSLNSALQLLHDEGELVRLGRAQYRWHELPMSPGGHLPSVVGDRLQFRQSGPFEMLPPVAPFDVRPKEEQSPSVAELKALVDDMLVIMKRAEDLLRRFSRVAGKDRG